ncbi:hypothetical protein [Streptomyces sp. NPDC049879]|uniref:hypothetical protein n=1 Tax=Streptomyces sp. NPDC049879 TaxID=3365598 RepID=UPI0037B14FAD
MTDTTGHEPQDQEQQDHGQEQQHQEQPAAKKRDELKEALGESRRELGALAAEIRGQLAAGGRARWTYTRTGAAEYVAAGESWLDQALRGTFCAVPPVGLAALTAEIPQTLALTVPLALAALWRAGGDPDWLKEATARRKQRRADEEERRLKRTGGGPAAKDGDEQPPVEDDGQEEPLEDDAEEAPPGPTDAEFVGIVRDLLGPRGSGVHLAEIQTRLEADFPAFSWPLEEVHALADRAGIPRAATRSPNRGGSTTGIRARDLPPLPSPQEGTPGGPVDQQQHRNNNINNAAREDVEIGAGSYVRYPHGRTAAVPTSQLRRPRV